MRLCRWRGLREHLRLGTGFGEDGLQDPVLAGFLRAALAAIEGRTGKALIARDFLYTRAGGALPTASLCRWRRWAW